MNNIVVPNDLDPNVQKLISSFISRAAKGKAKYGVDTTRDDLDLLQWVTHLQEELMDAVVYIERIKSDIKESGLL